MSFSNVRVVSSPQSQDVKVQENNSSSERKESTHRYEGRKVKVMQGFSQAARIVNWGKGAAFIIYICEHEKVKKTPNKDIPYEQLSAMHIRDVNFGYEGEKTESSVRERMEKLKENVHLKNDKELSQKWSFFSLIETRKNVIECLTLQNSEIQKGEIALREGGYAWVTLTHPDGKKTEHHDSGNALSYLLGTKFLPLSNLETHIENFDKECLACKEEVEAFQK